MVGIKTKTQRRQFAFPAFSFVSALATVLLIIVFVGDYFTSSFTGVAELEPEPLLIQELNEAVPSELQEKALDIEPAGAVSGIEPETSEMDDEEALIEASPAAMLEAPLIAEEELESRAEQESLVAEDQPVEESDYRVEPLPTLSIRGEEITTHRKVEELPPSAVLNLWNLQSNQTILWFVEGILLVIAIISGLGAIYFYRKRVG